MTKPYEKIRKRKTREYRMKFVKEHAPLFCERGVMLYYKCSFEIQEYINNLRFYNFIKKSVAEGCLFWCDRYIGEIIDEHDKLIKYVNSESNSNECVFSIEMYHNDFMKHYNKFKKLTGKSNDNQKRKS